MKMLLSVLCTTVLAGAALSAQMTGRPPSTPGSAEVEVGGKWVTGKNPSGRDVTKYEGGKWVSISYSRPLKRGRELFGTGDAYATKLNAGAPVWRAGADVSTRLTTEAPLVIGGKTLAPGEYLLFIDLKPKEWTLIVSSHKPQLKYDPQNKTEIWGAYGYDAKNDVVRVPMQVAEIPFSLEELSWGFADVTDKGFTLHIWWDKMNASVPVTLG
jgi:Protein of unknown function (DUF2911)